MRNVRHTYLKNARNNMADETHSYDGWNVVEEDFGGAYQYNYIDEGMDRHLAVEYVDGNGTGYLYYLLTDERGSVVALIDPSGNIVERYSYTVYGDRLTVMDANNLGNGFAYVAGMVIEHSDPTGLKSYDLESICKDMPKEHTIEGKELNAWKEVGDAIMKTTIAGSVTALAVTLGTKVSAAFAAAMENPVIGIPIIVAGIALTISINLKDAQELKTAKLNGVATETALDLATTPGVDRENVKVSQKVLKSGDIETKVKGKTEDGKNIEITVITDRKGNKKTKEVKKDGKIVASYVWDPNKNGEGKGGWVKVTGIPSSPDKETDMAQDYFKSQMLKKMLGARFTAGEKRNPWDPRPWEEDEYVEIETYNGKKVFIHNPFYRGKDPMKEIYWKHKNADETWVLPTIHFSSRKAYNTVAHGSNLI